ncbi:hypothetical protein SPRG_20251 [Saprolegnia parasitica CBS 223.65]|uniref:Uncharacterized protein n=1 Tax=Saprolegnia parasitica (strain CBS 223.65) TaxID=695850 RepID=A0A067CC71_SAPPC|nr:hypothetical protein SPRG_20251 [Saprolegnia parasitica CBS 223.65]KDO28093.1 hypothetical protein SPRG_20251 [Saprolegnia parasitica CBS 223.65]|eukprot:XP_012201237.1 hypothetical protein SPRG_20251 [Saprolegnia parasitica CBS 223.65]
MAESRGSWSHLHRRSAAARSASRRRHHPRRLARAKTWSSSSTWSSRLRHACRIATTALEPWRVCSKCKWHFAGRQPHKRGVVYCEVSLVCNPSPASVLPAQSLSV